MPLLDVRQVSYRYPDGRFGLENCSLQFFPATRNALLGANGSGKTTLLQHLNGLLKPRHGHIIYAGTPIDYSRKGLFALRARIGLVFQNPDRQLFSADVREDVSFGPMNLDLDEATVRQRVDASLAAVNMTHLANQPLHALSFGQKKRVAIAGVLAMQPEVLLLDEPMSGLDATMQAELLTLLEGLSAGGITIVLSTHDVDFAYRWADAIHLLAGGRCTASFAACDLPQHVDTLRTAGQTLPSVLAVQETLKAHGVLHEGPGARSLPELLARLS